MSTLATRLSQVIRDIPDFPKPGILFKDITPILAQPALMQEITEQLAATFAGEQIDVIVGMESRGFLFGVPLALRLGLPFAPARKPGKLPYESVGVEYALEYGSAKLEMHVDAVSPGQRVLVVDDLLATGGTAAATNQLVRQLGGDVVANVFVIELTFLPGRETLQGTRVESLVRF
jgi:adenine phosphoribosyltransferase